MLILLARIISYDKNKEVVKRKRKCSKECAKHYELAVDARIF
jgi:hypothetical protein